MKVIHPKYYLDTNAVRSLSAHLGKCVPAEGATSVLVLCELLGRVIKKPEDFEIYKKNLQSLFRSKLPIAVMMPMDIQASAFGFDPLNIEASWHIIRLAQILCECDDASHWKSQAEQHGYSSTYQVVAAIDDQYPNFTELLRSHYSTRTPAEDQKLYRQFQESLDKEAAMGRIIAYYADCMIEQRQDVRQAGVLLGCSFEEWKKFLCCAYDHSVDIALWAGAQYVDKKVSLRENPRRNDEIDLLHLYYLQQGMTLVTDDKGLRTLVNAEFPSIAITTEEFKSRCLI